MFLLDNSDPRPLHVKLYHQIKNQILSGKLLPHTKLPSVRHLAADLSVSRNTVEYAYEQLSMEGFIYSIPQSGYYISLLDQEFFPSPRRNPLNCTEAALETEENYLFDFHPAGLARDSFPSKIWRKLLSDYLRENPGQFTYYGNPQGERELRCQIQRYLELFRGVTCNPEQIVVTCGLQDNLSLLAQILSSDHSSLAIEDPGHWIPRSVFQNYSFSLHPVPVNSGGINLEYLKNTDSTVVYVTPSHQFPLGYVMPVENRLRMINWAETVRGVIIEDDYDSELRYHGKPIPALQGLHPEGNIIYLGSFSKVLSPALRVSYMVLPYQFLGAYSKMFGKFTPTVSLLEQKTLSQFMAQGYWERHLRKMRIIYKRKHDALIQSIEHHFGTKANILGRGAGLHIVLELADSSMNEKNLICRARRENVRVFSLADTYLSNNHHPVRVMLGFGRMSPDELEQGIARLSRAWSL